MSEYNEKDVNESLGAFLSEKVREFFYSYEETQYTVMDLWAKKLPYMNLEYEHSTGDWSKPRRLTTPVLTALKNVFRHSYSLDDNATFLKKLLFLENRGVKYSKCDGDGNNALLHYLNENRIDKNSREVLDFLIDRCGEGSINDNGYGVASLILSSTNRGVRDNDDLLERFIFSKSADEIPDLEKLKEIAKNSDLGNIKTKIIKHLSDGDFTKDELNESLINAVRKHKNEDYIKYLLDCGADPNIKTGRDKDAPLLMSCNSTSYIDLLLDAGANINAKDELGNSVLYSAIDRGEYYIAESLIEKGANVNTISRWGHSPIEAAITTYRNSMHEGRQVDLVKKLVEKGADINFSKENWFSVFGYFLAHSNITSDTGKENLKWFCENVDLSKNNASIAINATKRLKVDLLKFLSKKGIRFSENLCDGENALHVLSKKVASDSTATNAKKVISIAKFLLASDVDCESVYKQINDDGERSNGDIALERFIMNVDNAGHINLLLEKAGSELIEKLSNFKQHEGLYNSSTLLDFITSKVPYVYEYNHEAIYSMQKALLASGADPIGSSNFGAFYTALTKYDKRSIKNILKYIKNKDKLQFCPFEALAYSAHKGVATNDLDNSKDIVNILNDSGFEITDKAINVAKESEADWLVSMLENLQINDEITLNDVNKKSSRARL